MPLFACSKCETVENTALGSFWGQSPRLCSECATGVWHGIFSKKNAFDGSWLVGRYGYLYRAKEAEASPHMGPFTPYARPTEPEQA